MPLTLTLRRASRWVAGPAFLLMIGGLAVARLTAMAIRAEPEAEQLAASWLTVELPGSALARPEQILQPGVLLSGEGLVAIGLLALIGLPAVAVAIITIRRLQERQWTDALIAAGVLGILVLSNVLGR